jgi:hypothetical protein
MMCFTYEINCKVSVQCAVEDTKENLKERFCGCVGDRVQLCKMLFIIICTH